MRWIYWSAVMSMLLLAGPAAVYAGCNCNGNDVAGYRAYGGPACFAPPGFCLAPGCCECQPSACDNAWEGYCAHKARWQAFFYSVGVPKNRCGCCCMVPVLKSCYCSTDCNCTAEVQPTMENQAVPAGKQTSPAPTPAPLPMPGKGAWKWTNPWIR